MRRSGQFTQTLIFPAKLGSLYTNTLSFLPSAVNIALLHPQTNIAFNILLIVSKSANEDEIVGKRIITGQVLGTEKYKCCFIKI